MIIHSSAASGEKTTAEILIAVITGFATSQPQSVILIWNFQRKKTSPVHEEILVSMNGAMIGVLKLEDRKTIVIIQEGTRKPEVRQVEIMKLTHIVMMG